MTDEIECRDCNGEGRIWNNADPTSGQSVDCDDCHGTGWREPTQEELNDLAADAYSDMCEGEPPISFSERTAMESKRDAQWGVK